MEVLWKRGEASVQQVVDEIALSEPIAYTTGLTMLRILYDKGYVEYRKEGKAHVYVPTVSRDVARAMALRQLLRRFFDNSPQALAQHLVQVSHTDAQELERLSARVRAAKKKAKRS